MKSYQLFLFINYLNQICRSVSDELGIIGKTPQHCKNQWINLSKKYKEITRPQSGNGTGEESSTQNPEDWDLFPIFHDWAKKKDNFHPQFLISSTEGERYREDVVNLTREPSSSSGPPKLSTSSGTSSYSAPLSFSQRSETFRANGPSSSSYPGTSSSSYCAHPSVTSRADGPSGLSRPGTSSGSLSNSLPSSCSQRPVARKRKVTIVEEYVKEIKRVRRNSKGINRTLKQFLGVYMQSTAIQFPTIDFTDQFIIEDTSQSSDSD